MEFCFADSRGMLEEQSDSFKSQFLTAFSVAASALKTLQQYPLLRIVSNAIPVGLLKVVSPELGNLIHLTDVSSFWSKDFFKPVVEALSDPGSVEFSMRSSV